MFSPKMLQLSLLAKGIEELVILRPCLRSFATTSSEPFQKLYVSKNNEDFIAYRKHVPMNPSKDTGVIFCQGLMSNMCGVKARFLESYCKEKELNYVCFDYMGHGQSSGKFEDFTLSLWKENTLDVLAKVAEGNNSFLFGPIHSFLSFHPRIVLQPDIKSVAFVLSCSRRSVRTHNTGFTFQPSTASREKTGKKLYCTGSEHSRNQKWALGIFWGMDFDEVVPVDFLAKSILLLSLQDLISLASTMSWYAG